MPEEKERKTHDIQNVGEHKIVLVAVNGKRYTLKPYKSCSVWTNAEGKIMRVAGYRVSRGVPSIRISADAPRSVTGLAPPSAPITYNLIA